MNKVANCNEWDKINPLTTVEIAKAQQADAILEHLFKHNAELIKDWRSNSLRTQLVPAKLVG
jgi:hypothetical protein